MTAPGEVTAELGRRTRAAVLTAARGAGIRRVVLAGYANEYASYFTTPEEYDAQHYEGGTTVYGPASGPFLTASLADLARPAGRRRPAPAPHRFDPTLGLRPTARPVSARAPRAARVLAQPRATARLGHARLRWRGGGSGTDRPLDRPFVAVQRHTARGWRTTDTDLGLSILWRRGRRAAEGRGHAALPGGRDRHLHGHVGAAARRLRPAATASS